MLSSRLGSAFCDSPSFLYICSLVIAYTVRSTMMNVSYAHASALLAMASGLSVAFERFRSLMQDSPFSRDTSAKVSLTVVVLAMVESLGRSVI